MQAKYNLSNHHHTSTSGYKALFGTSRAAETYVYVHCPKCKLV